MVARSKLTFVCYGVGLVLFFALVGRYLVADQKGDLPTLLEWICLPGTLLAIYCLVGVHSDHFILASILANIAVYLLVPYLVWKLAGFFKKPRPASPKK
jgi:hypothetical protein